MRSIEARAAHGKKDDRRLVFVFHKEKKNVESRRMGCKNGSGI